MSAEALLVLSLVMVSPQSEAPLKEAPAPRAPLVIRGIVLDSRGLPAAGARVASSAGGQDFTSPDGSYRIETTIPVDAERVWITATSSAGANLVARREIDLSAISPHTDVDPLLLTQGQACAADWLPTFGAVPGPNDDVNVMLTFDDGSGPALFAGGRFTTIGETPASRIAKWDGASWSSVGSGVEGSIYESIDVNALAVFDDGGGPALYAGGTFATAGGVTVNGLARWNGASWSALGEGVNSEVSALALFDDGSGPALYAGGRFTLAGGAPANRIARWNGHEWTPLGSGIEGDAPNLDRVAALAVYDDGSGPALYAGGSFTIAGGVAARSIAKWDGASWSPVGAGLGRTVYAMTVWDDGSGPALFVGGTFHSSGGAGMRLCAKWNGSWTQIPLPGDDWSPLTLQPFQDEGGPALYVGGGGLKLPSVEFGRIVRWDGVSGSSPGNIDRLDGFVSALAVFDGVGGPALHVGGRFVSGATEAGALEARRVMRWTGASWLALHERARTATNTVYSLLSFDAGSGLSLFVGGVFDFAGGTLVRSIGRWSGAEWHMLGGGVRWEDELSDGLIRCMEPFDDGSGPKLVAGGGFGIAGEISVNSIASWNETVWSRLGGGFFGVGALCVFDAGAGPSLYAGALTVKRFNGSQWQIVAAGVNEAVLAMATWDDGAGPGLYVGGRFTTAGGFPATKIAKWNGLTWAPLGSGIEGGDVWALAAFDDGSGPALYAGGDFATAGGTAASNIARWDGAGWTPLSSGTNGAVNALAVFDDGSGPALYAGGEFTTAGGVAANRIARWDGTAWSPVGSGTSGPVHALAVHDDGGGLALFVGGKFQSAFDSGDAFLAKWGCPDLVPPTIACPERVLHGDRVGTAPGAIVHFTVAAFDDRDPEPSIVCSPASGSLFPRGTTWVTCTATDSSGNEATCSFPVTVAAGRKP